MKMLELKIEDLQNTVYLRNHCFMRLKAFFYRCVTKCVIEVDFGLDTYCSLDKSGRQESGRSGFVRLLPRP